jgi:hypothetical protein
MIEMTILIVLTSYLIIGAIIGWKDSELVEDVIEISLDTVNVKSDNSRKATISVCLFLIIIVAPTLELYFIIRKLKSKLGR